MCLLFEYLEARGVDATALLGEAAPIPGGANGGRYPIARWAILLETAARHLRDPLLGLNVGRTITPRHVGILGYLVQNCETVGDALALYRRFESLFYDLTFLDDAKRGSVGQLEWTAPPSLVGHLVHDCSIAALVQLGRDITRGELRFEAVHFVYPEPADVAPYVAFFGCPVRFDQPTNVVRVPVDCLAVRLRAPDPVLLAVLERQAEDLVAKTGTADEEGEVRRCIARLLPDGQASLEHVARELGTSTRTLHRRLEARGFSFRELLDDARRRIAEDYLRDPALDLAAISQLLGFAEQSAFTRAFKRWTGETPLRWRAAAGPRRPARG